MFCLAMNDEVTYELAAVRWRRSDSIDILSILDTRIAVFPLDFVSSCGDCTWKYVLRVVEQLVVPIPGHRGVIVTEQGDPVDPEMPPSAGVFRYKQLGRCMIIGRILNAFCKAALTIERGRYRACFLARS
jgi:hypothetical protein